MLYYFTNISIFMVVGKIDLVKFMCVSNDITTNEVVKKTFVDNGMRVDICIHDSGDGKPHAHVLLTMRPLKKYSL